MKTIKLTKGKEAIVDDEDYKLVSQYKWQANGDGYAVRTTWLPDRVKRTVMLHRFLMKPPKGRIVDHINRNRLDNRRTNLRVCTRTQNAGNIKYSGGTSEYNGVFKHVSIQPQWRTSISCKDKSIQLGIFENEHHAALAYDLWAVDLRGEFASTNFPVVGHSSIKSAY